MEDFIESLKNNPSVVISICALLLTMYQAWATRKHNRLSVQPRLTTHLRIERDAAEEGITRVIATLSNSGLGPAIIKSFEMLVNDKPYFINEQSEIESLVVRNITGHIVELRTGFFRKHHTFSKDATTELLNLKIKNATESNLEEIELFNIRVTYESAYGESFSYDSRTHMG
jgi:hypothetical protein